MFFFDTERYFKNGQESMDRMIFDIFDLSGNNLISEEELSQMLLTLPEQAIISNLNKDLV